MIVEAHRAMVGKPGQLAMGLADLFGGVALSVDARASLLRVAQLIEAMFAPPKT